MLAEAQQAGDAYNQTVQGADNDPFAAALPWEVGSTVGEGEGAGWPEQAARERSMAPAARRQARRFMKILL